MIDLLGENEQGRKRGVVNAFGVRSDNEDKAHWDQSDCPCGEVSVRTLKKWGGFAVRVGNNDIYDVPPLASL